MARAFLRTRIAPASAIEAATMPHAPPMPATRPRAVPIGRRALERPADLLLFNGRGGYRADGREYRIWLPAGENTPLPWANVLANPGFGTVLSESGSAYTWNENAREFRLSPWHNDPVTDLGGEAIYLRDERSGACWSPAPGRRWHSRIRAPRPGPPMRAG